MDKLPNTWRKISLKRTTFSFKRLPFVSVSSLSWITFFLICTLNLYEYVLRVSPSVMTSGIMFSYQIDATEFGQLSSYFYLIYAPMQICVGVLMDRYGPYYLLPFATLICVMGVFLFASSSAIWIAQLGRALMGFGSAFAFVGGLKVLMHTFAPQRFGFLTGWVVSFCLLGGILGEVYLAMLLKKWDWQTLCYGIALFGVVLFFLMFSIMYKQKKGLIEKTVTSNWQSVFLGLRQILKNPNIWLMAIIGCCFYLPTSVFAELWGVSYLKAEYGFTNIEAAYMVSMIFLGWAVGCPTMGWISDYLRKPRMLMIFGAFSSFVLLFIMLVRPAVLRDYLSWCMFGLGFFGSTQMLVISMIRQHVSLENASTAMSFLNMFVLMGGFLFQPWVGFLLDRFWQGNLMNGIRLYSGSDYQAALCVLPIALLIGIFLTLMGHFQRKE